MADDKQLIITRAFVPQALTHAWLQHLRDFDTLHPGCHFEIMLEDSGLTMREMIDKITLDPEMNFISFFPHKQSQ